MKHFEAVNDGTDEEPSWTLYDHEGDYLDDAETLDALLVKAKHFIIQVSVFASYTHVNIQLKAAG